MSLVSRIEDLASRISLEVKNKADKKPGLVDSLQWGDVGRPTIAHRNGMNVYPEASMEGMEACATAGFMLEVDVYRLVDGTLVCIHDSTVDRTMINISTGNVTSKTVKQWRQARIKPATVGFPTGTPMFFEDVLDFFGGRVVLVPELKEDAAITPFINAITSRHLERDVIAQSFNWSNAQALAAAGIETMFLSGTLPMTGPANFSAVKAAGINYISGGYNHATWTGTQITSAKSAGLITVGFTVDTPTQQESAFSLGWDGVFSNDPWWTSGQIPLSYGFYPSFAPPITLRWRDDSTPKPLLFAGGIGRIGGSGSAMNCDWIPKLNFPLRIDMDILYLDGAGNTGTSAGFYIWNNTSTPDAEWVDGITTGQNAFTVIARRSGQIAAYTYTNGGNPTQLTSPAQSQWYGSGASLINANFAESTTGEGLIHLTADFTATTLKVHGYGNYGLPAFASYTHSLNPSNMRFGLRCSQDFSIRNLSLTPL